VALIQLEVNVGDGPWRVIVEGSAVSVLGGRNNTLIGSGEWSGKGVRKRYTVDEPITDKQWAAVEKAVRDHQTKGPPPPRAAVSEVSIPSPTTEGFEVIVDLSTGDIVHYRPDIGRRRPANAFEYKVEVQGDVATISALDADDFARATWTGGALVDHEVKSAHTDKINDYQWGVVQTALIAATGGTVPEAPRAMERPRAADVTPVGRARPTVTTGDQRGDGRSGWWALGAALTTTFALAGSLLFGPAGDQVMLGVNIALGVLALGLWIYGGYGLATRCPSCKAWYRRKLTDTTNLGSHTTTRQVSKPVYDSSGKQSGTTYETATYEVTKYRYSYRCKECSHQWTGAGTSERRIS